MTDAPLFLAPEPRPTGSRADAARPASAAGSATRVPRTKDGSADPNAENRTKPAPPQAAPLKTLADGMPPLIDTPEQLASATRSLARSRLPVAIDTERVHGYLYESGVYLVQIRRDDVGTFLVDPHALPDLTALSAALDDRWILHAADQDLLYLQKVGMAPQQIFDTEIAARLLGIQQFSLSAVLAEALGVSLEKSHQNENWAVRPLPREWLRYAAMDVELLTQLEAELRNRLVAAGRLEWAEQEFAHELTHPLVQKENRWENLTGVNRLRLPQELATARELWLARDEVAKELNIAPSRLLNNKGIVEAARQNPQTRRGLQSIQFFRQPRARAHLDVWWDAVRRAHGLTTPEMPTREDLRPPADSIPAARYWKQSRPAAARRLAAMRQLVAAAADPLAIDPDVALAPALQRAVAWTPLAGRASGTAALQERLVEAGARPWQQELVAAQAAAAPDLAAALSRD